MTARLPTKAGKLLVQTDKICQEKISIEMLIFSWLPDPPLLITLLDHRYMTDLRERLEKVLSLQPS
jgi:hypothetical protein